MRSTHRIPLVVCLAMLWTGPTVSGVSAGSPFPLTAMGTHLVRQEQRVITRVQLSGDGTLRGTMVLENGRKLWGLCAVSHFAVKDNQGNILETHSFPEACVGEPEEETVRKVVTWEGKVKNPDTVSRAAKIQIRSFQSPLEEEIPSLEELFH